MFFGVGVSCRILYSFVDSVFMDQLPGLGKRELIFLLLFTCNHVVYVRRSYSSSCLGWAALFYCSTH